jgi:broad specificity phosphatase PhoE
VGELLVVRHGQSTWNACGTFTGQADPGLTDLGRRQAEVLASRCGGLGVGTLVTSDLARARSTGEVVAAVLGLAPPVELMDLRERWSRGLTGRSCEEIETTWPGTLAAWREGRPVAAPGPHEDFGHFTARVLRGLVEAHRRGGRILVVAHAGVFVVLTGCFGGARAEVANAEGVVVDVDGDRVRGVVGELVLPALGEVGRTGLQEP